MKIKFDSAKDFLIKIQSRKHEKTNSSFSVDNSRKNILNLKILVCLDVSGSISPEQFAQFMSQIDQIKGLSTVKILETDSRVVAMYDYVVSHENKIARLKGGGGTEFSAAFDVAKKLNPDAILFMTDGFVFDKVEDPGIPTGWVLTHDGVIPYEFGVIAARLPQIQ